MAASPHPVDQLIRELVTTGRPATPDDVASIVARMATAPFDARPVPVPSALRGTRFRGHLLGARESALLLHLAKRVADERQWASGTTAAQYLRDLRRGIRHLDARVVVYERRGGYVAAALSPTDAAVPLARRGAEALPQILVVYSADRGIIVSGYQVSGIERTGIPREARWLR